MVFGVGPYGPGRKRQFSFNDINFPSLESGFLVSPVGVMMRSLILLAFLIFLNGCGNETLEQISVGEGSSPR